MGFLQKILDTTRSDTYTQLNESGTSQKPEEIIAAGMEELKKPTSVSLDNDGDSHINLKIKTPDEVSETVNGIAREIIAIKETGIVSNKEIKALKNMLAMEIETLDIKAIYNGEIASDYVLNNSSKHKFSQQKADSVVDAMFNVGKDKATTLAH